MLRAGFQKLFFLFGATVGGSLSAQTELIPAPTAPRAMVAESAEDVAKGKAAFQSHVYRAPDGRTLPYRQLSPGSVANGVKYPLVLMLHGSGAIGTNNEAQLGAFARAWADAGVAERFPAYVIAPQFPERSANYRKSSDDGLLAAEAGPRLADVIAMLETVATHEAVDRARIYVVGFSMGASTGWELLLLRPKFFAAAVLLSGIPPERTLAPQLTGTPLLVVHGNADTENPIEPDRAMIKALQHAGAKQVRFREYEKMEHTVPAEIMDRTRAGDAWREWLFAQRR